MGIETIALIAVIAILAVIGGVILYSTTARKKA